ncbi:MFS transporter [Tenggerimyces flavus]|uniref:MFS transporter n=1 Tax=Tenggerimyces flavus TaxID=1708749 RepID=A0ABV7YCW5_9ACTN|nr:MFS transporter [Tenggerimyces flavus]MBM7787978.1 MFS family permease [Tenggerimyces flavus]
MAESPTLRRWRPLWFSYAVSASGTSVASGILPIIAILHLHASAAQVSALAAISAVAGGVGGTLSARLFDRAPRLAVLRWIQLFQCASLAVLLIVAAVGWLTFTHLVVVAAIQAAGFIAYAAGFNLHLKQSLEDDDLIVATSRIEATTWTTQSIGPMLGGVLTSAVGPFLAVAIDALSFVASALGLAKAKDDRQPRRGPNERLGGGLPYIWRNDILRPLYLNAMTLGGGLLMASPLVALLMLRDLGLPAWQYGLAVGLPAVAGLAGAFCAPRLHRALGQRRTLLFFGALRGPCLVPLALAPSGPAALWVILGSQALLLFAAGVFNPTFATTRLQASSVDMIARVSAAWSGSAKVVQPACIALGGLIAAATSVRVALGAAAALGVASVVALPWRRSSPD